MRGQIEVVGLVVIVLLVLVGGAIFLRLGSSRDVSDFGIKESIEANNMRNALLKTTICDVSVEDAVAECYNKGVLCRIDACEYTKNKIQEILDLSLPANKDFNLIVKADGDLLFELGKCSRKGVTASQAPIIKKGVLYDIDYKMCNK